MALNDWRAATVDSRELIAGVHTHRRDLVDALRALYGPQRTVQKRAVGTYVFTFGGAVSEPGTAVSVWVFNTQSYLVPEDFREPS